jgi:hypothetical protein
MFMWKILFWPDAFYMILGFLRHDVISWGANHTFRGNVVFMGQFWCFSVSQEWDDLGSTTGGNCFTNRPPTAISRDAGSAFRNTTKDSKYSSALLESNANKK